MATAQSQGNQISMENWSSPFLLGISMWFSSFCSFFPKSDVTPGMLGRFVGGVGGGALAVRLHLHHLHHHLHVLAGHAEHPHQSPIGLPLSLHLCLPISPGLLHLSWVHAHA